MTSISCIIPTWNRGPLLLEAIESALRQTYPPHEVLVVNNGPHVVEMPAELSGRVTVHDIVAHAGVSQARNFGAALAAGDYFAFLDDDDMWNERYLEYATRAIARGERLIVGRLDEFDAEGVRPYKNAVGNLTIRALLARNPGTNGSNVVVERALFHELRGFDATLPASTDKSFIMEALIRDVPIAIVPEMQVLLRTHAGDRITTNPARMAEGVWQFTRKYARYMQTDELLHNVEKAYRHKKSAVAARLTEPGGEEHGEGNAVTSSQKRALVLRMLRGETSAAIAGETGIHLDELEKWRRIGERVVRFALMDAFTKPAHGNG
jgi:glycosyltransferase involved in cell wall biosynthesis